MTRPGHEPKVARDTRATYDHATLPGTNASSPRASRELASQSDFDPPMTARAPAFAAARVPLVSRRNLRECDDAGLPG